MLFSKARQAHPLDPGRALPGRERAIAVAENHAVLGTPLQGPWPEGVREAVFGMGCFWGAERVFWQAQGSYSTAVGYAGGLTPNPTYEEVCNGLTGHAEVVLIAYDTAATSFEEMLRLFWEGHDPTQGMRQGNDVGTQYRSIVLCEDYDQLRAALRSRDAYQHELSARGHGEITTEIVVADGARSAEEVPPGAPDRSVDSGPAAAPTPPFYYAEDYHQQYLAKNPGGYCGLGGTGVSCPVGVA